MRSRTLIGAAAAVALVGAAIARSALQAPRVLPLAESLLREYAGVYQWSPEAFVYLQLWNELAGANQLVAFDESGEVRTLYPTDRDRFFAGPGTAMPTAIESRVTFQRDAAGTLASLTWQRGDAPLRTAHRVHIEHREDVRFTHGPVQLAGTLIKPGHPGKRPAVILVHGSGPQNRDGILPFARFLIRRGMAVLAYDKRGVGGSTGDWTTASFEDLAGDVVAAFDYLQSRPDIDAEQVGLFGVSQAGWIMPLAAVRVTDIAFLISVSGAGVSGAETAIDHARHEMSANGMQPQLVDQIIGIMKLQIAFARTGEGWGQYAAAREKLATRLGAPPDNFPATPDHAYWQSMRRLYLYDPGPTLRQLQVPTLALFGELDNNILAEKNTNAWEAALKAAGNRDYTLRTLPRANHIHLEAKVGNNAEIKTLRRFVPEYFTTIHQWLATRIRGLGSV
jgi:pimeloyl-ACP methyl ester carboxylesterase